MARKRMFSLDIIDTDLFLDMPSSAQNLYFHLGMRGDDDGFVSSPKKILKLISGAEDDMKLLRAKGFVIPFDTGICVIRHWKIHNYIQKDRYKPSIYTEEKARIHTEKNHVYSLDTECVQDVSRLETQGRGGEVRLGEIRGERAREQVFHDIQPPSEKSELPPLNSINKIKAMIAPFESGNNKLPDIKSIECIILGFEAKHGKQSLLNILTTYLQEKSDKLAFFVNDFTGYLKRHAKNNKHVPKKFEKDPEIDDIKNKFETEGKPDIDFDAIKNGLRPSKTACQGVCECGNVVKYQKDHKEPLKCDCGKLWGYSRVLDELVLQD